MLNSRVTFSSLLTIVLGGLEDFSDAFIDGIVIFSALSHGSNLGEVNDMC